MSFAVLAEAGVTSVGATTVNGNVGSVPTNSVTGFPPALITGGSIMSPAIDQVAESDALAAYLYLGAQSPTQNLTGTDLGGLTLTPGVYDFSSSAQLTGTLTLNAQGSGNAVFIFDIGSTLTTAANAVVSVINGGPGDSVYWQVGSSATLGASTLFEGNILADTSITLDSSAQIACGRALAGIVTSSGSVVLADSNNIAINNGAACVGGYAGEAAVPSPLPEPSSFALLVLGLFGLGVAQWQRRSAWR